MTVIFPDLESASRASDSISKGNLAHVARVRDTKNGVELYLIIAQNDLTVEKDIGDVLSGYGGKVLSKETRSLTAG